MNCVFLITSKPFAFSTFKVANKFREEYTPLVETQIGPSSHLSLPDERGKIVPVLASPDIKVYDTIEDCLRDFPHEKFFKYINDAKKIKVSIPLKTPLVFDNHKKGNSRVVLKSNKINYHTLNEVVEMGRENVKDLQNPTENTIVATLEWKNKGSINPVAAITLKQFKEMEMLLAKTNEKLDKLKQEFGVIEEENEAE